MSQPQHDNLEGKECRELCDANLKRFTPECAKEIGAKDVKERVGEDIGKLKDVLYSLTAENRVFVVVEGSKRRSKKALRLLQKEMVPYAWLDLQKLDLYEKVKEELQRSTGKSEAPYIWVETEFIGEAENIIPHCERLKEKFATGQETPIEPPTTAQ